MSSIRGRIKVRLKNRTPAKSLQGSEEENPLWNGDLVAPMELITGTMNIHKQRKEIEIHVSESENV